jgi:hypothetical protein
MESVIIEVSKTGCKDCPYRQEKVIDHNYYGETSLSQYCRLFDTQVGELTPCDACIQLREKSTEDWIALADEINRILKEGSHEVLDRFVGCLARKMDSLDVIGTAIMALIREARREFE